MKKRVIISIKYVVLALIALLFLLPIVYMLANSLMPSDEMTKAYTNSPGHYADFHLIPDNFSL